MNKITKDTAFRILLSVSLAFFLWVFAMTNTDPMITQKYSAIPVTYQNTESINSNNLMVESSTEKIEVKLYGSTVQVSKIKNSDIIAVADLSKITKEGIYTVEITVKGIPQNISVTDISPKFITIEVSKITQEKSNYFIELSGSPQNGYAVLGHTEDTSNVTLSGSAATTSQVAAIKGTIDVSGKNQDFTSTVVLSAFDKNGVKINNITLNPSEIHVTVSIGITKTVDMAAVSSGACADGFALDKITLNPAQITIAGKADTINKITSLSTENIDIANRNASFTQDVAIIVPNDVWITGNKDSVSANISIQPLSEISFTYDTLQVRNTPAGMSCDLSSFTGLNMTVQGFASYLNNTTKDSIKIYIDLNGLTPGTHIVDIHYELPPNITVKSMDKTNISIILSPQ